MLCNSTGLIKIIMSEDGHTDHSDEPRREGYLSPYPPSNPYPYPPKSDEPSPNVVVVMSCAVPHGVVNRQDRAVDKQRAKRQEKPMMELPSSDETDSNKCCTLF